MNIINEFFSVTSSLLWGWPMIILLLGTHLFLTIRLHFPQRHILKAIRLSVQRDPDATGDVSQLIVQAFEENDDADLNALLVDRHIEAREIIDELGDDAKFAIDYLKRINALLEGTPFKLGYRAANEALIYLQASQEFGHTDRIAALDNFTLMKILSRIEGDETKLKITDSDADKERIANAGVNIDEAKRYGDFNILTALRNIITQMLGESGNTDVESNVTEETATESGEEMN